MAVHDIRTHMMETPKEIQQIQIHAFSITAVVSCPCGGPPLQVVFVPGAGLAVPCGKCRTLYNIETVELAGTQCNIQVRATPPMIVPGNGFQVR